MNESASINSRGSRTPTAGFSSFKSFSKFSTTFPHVTINHKADIIPSVVLNEEAFKYFMLRFLPLETRFDSCVKKGNEKSMYFLVYELLSTVATYGKVKETEGVQLSFNDQKLEDYSAFLHHEFSLANTEKTANGPVEFVTSFHQNVNKNNEGIVSLVEVKHSMLPTESIFETTENNPIYQFYAQLAVAVENNRLNENPGLFLWGAYTDGYTWIFARAKSAGINLTDSIEIQLAKPVMLHLNHQATLSSKRVVEFLFSALMPTAEGELTLEEMRKSYSLFDAYSENKTSNFFAQLEELSQKDAQISELYEKIDSVIAEKDSVISEKDSVIAEKDSEIERLTAELAKLNKK